MIVRIDQTGHQEKAAQVELNGRRAAWGVLDAKDMRYPPICDRQRRGNIFVCGHRTHGSVKQNRRMPPHRGRGDHTGFLAE